jgi:hypothetical protein
LTHFENKPPKGEIVVVVGGKVEKSKEPRTKNE